MSIKLEIDKEIVTEVEKRLKEQSLMPNKQKTAKRTNNNECYKVKRLDFVVALWHGRKPDPSMGTPRGPVRDYKLLAEWLRKAEEKGLFMNQKSRRIGPTNHKKFMNDVYYYVYRAKKQGLI